MAEGERPEIAEEFLLADGRQAGCDRCTRKAVVRFNGLHWCARCWEFVER